MSLIQENCFASVSELQLEPSFPDRDSQSTRNWLSKRPAPNLVSGVSAGTALSPQRQCLVWSPTDLSAPVSPCGCWRQDAVSELASSLQPFLVVRWCISHVCYQGKWVCDLRVNASKSHRNERTCRCQWPAIKWNWDFFFWQIVKLDETNIVNFNKLTW